MNFERGDREQARRVYAARIDGQRGGISSLREIYTKSLRPEGPCENIIDTDVSYDSEDDSLSSPENRGAKKDKPRV